MAIFHSVLVGCLSVPFWLWRCKIHSLVSFFRLDLFFGLRFFMDSVLINLQGVLIYLVLFSGLFKVLSVFSDSVDFSCPKSNFFLNFLGAFCVGLLLPHFSSFWFCSF